LSHNQHINLYEVLYVYVGNTGPSHVTDMM